MLPKMEVNQMHFSDTSYNKERWKLKNAKTRV